MKVIYKVLSPVGYQEVNVSNDYQVTVPYTEVKPLPIEHDQSQFFDWSETRWKEAYTQDITKQLEMLTIVNESLQNQTTLLNEKISKQAEETLHTQLAIVEIYEAINGGEIDG